MIICTYEFVHELEKERHVRARTGVKRIESEETIKDKHDLNTIPLHLFILSRNRNENKIYRILYFACIPCRYVSIYIIIV